jgi:hypothetical protein
VFHVLLLKKSVADDAITSSFHSKMDDYGAVKFQLLIILDRKIIKKKAATMVLVQWSHLFKEYATSKKLEDLSSQFPEFNTNS